jgi:glycosyltransferase involved in cell wall biosynthesis
VRILLDYRPALRLRSGVGEYAHQLAAALLRTVGPADELMLFSSSWKDRLAPSILPGARHLDARVPVRVLNFAWHRLGWPTIERFAGRVDVAHSMHPLLMPARDAAQVVTVHDFFFLDYPDRTAAEVRRDYPELAGAHARRADAVIAVSHYTAREAERRLGVDPGRLTVCPPGAPSWTPRERPKAKGPILFVGTLEARKNVGALLDAYEQLLGRRPDMPPLVLAGRATANSRILVERLQRAPLAGRAQHLGYVTAAECERLYRSASVLVLPSFDEGFGVPVLEAMSIGLPVVASNRGALPEVAGGAAVLIDPEDRSALAGAIARLLDDAAAYAAAVENGLRRAQQFTWEKTASKLLEAYRSAVERRKERA